MFECSCYNLSGKKLESIPISIGEKPLLNTKLIKNYIVALNKNKRQWSANTKGRSDGISSGAKPHKQKGTGKARQGTLAAPQYKGGGRVHAPKPKFNQFVSVNKQERKAVIRYCFFEKIAGGSLVFLKNDFSLFEKPKTSVIAKFLDNMKCTSLKTIYLGDNANKNFLLSIRNMPFNNFFPFHVVSGYDLLLNKKVFVFDSVRSKLEGIFD